MNNIFNFAKKLGMKKYFYVGIAILLTLGFITIINLYNRAIKYEKLYNRELENVAAYQNDNAGLNG